jgi:hypothetical protein
MPALVPSSFAALAIMVVGIRTNTRMHELASKKNRIHNPRIGEFTNHTTGKAHAGVIAQVVGQDLGRRGG